MTQLEHLIQESVSRSVVNTLHRATETIAEELAHEILKDPNFRQQMRLLVQHAFARTFAELATDEPPQPPQ